MEWAGQTTKEKSIYFNRLQIYFHNISTNVDK